jgi:hypothetical protein
VSSMGDIGPSSAPRIDPLTAGNGKDSDHTRPGKPVKTQPTLRNVPSPPVDVEKDEDHQLDEQA